eukprot:Em0003g131a
MVFCICCQQRPIKGDNQLCCKCTEYRKRQPSQIADRPDDYSMKCVCCKFKYFDPNFVKLATYQCGDRYYLCWLCHRRHGTCLKDPASHETPESAHRFFIRVPKH